ncbi:hypothetical protein V495_01705 [Pseudogymnoascus sp. VKM F-4514 (FW-929)]|nr:hypothetical protein V495_01705 [Pseudogymnoascus sp. VKM F-4514 (FW-929)]KFY56302.1 hypothetical protein V497_06373 [Pseudogymnoascus sp. VKM F-4516 (FW-969)]
MDSPKYSKFDVSAVTYKVVNGQDIKAFVLTPKDISTGNHPVVVKFHGGFFVSGKSLFADWYAQWSLDYSLLHSAIIVAADYRLLPEATGAELYEDVSDAWDWVRNDLQTHLDSTKQGVKADLDKVLVLGESAGGAIALISALSQPPGFIKAVISTYPFITLSPRRTKPIFGTPVLPTSVLQDHLDSIQPGKIITEATPPDRINVAITIAQQELFPRYYGTDDKHDAFKLLEKANDLPYTFIFHGSEDSAVPVDGSIEWVAAAENRLGQGKVKLHIEQGAEHGFDDETPLETPWLQEGLKEVTENWLGTGAH